MDAPASPARPACPFTAMIAVGPDAGETPRLTQLLESIYFYEPAVPRIVFIDDSVAPRDLLAPLPAPPAGCRVEVIKGPRHGRGEPRLGGGCVTMLAGLRACAAGDAGRFVLKFDTDALVVAPFSGKIGELIDRTPDAGVIGACAMSPTGKPRGDEYQKRIFGNAATFRLNGKERKTVGRRRSFPTTLRQWKILRVARRAKRNGCTLGENVQGGGYAVTAEALRRMKKAGLLDDTMLWVDTFAGEDGVIPLYAKMLGTTLVDFVGHDEPFGVVYRGLPATPEEIVGCGYSIVHCTKNDERVSEADVYAFFARRRSGSLSRVRTGED